MTPPDGDAFPCTKLYLRTLKQLHEVVHLLLLVLSLFFTLKHAYIEL